jgi:hypothetical protein
MKPGSSSGLRFWKAGSPLRKLAKRETAPEIARKALAQGIPMETVAVITGLDIEKVREIAEAKRS